MVVCGVIVFVHLDVLESIRVDSHGHVRAFDSCGVTDDECTTTSSFRQSAARLGFLRGFQNDEGTSGIEDGVHRVHDIFVLAAVIRVGGKTREENMRFNADWKRGLFRRWLRVRTMALENMSGCGACDEIIIFDTPEYDFGALFRRTNNLVVLVGWRHVGIMDCTNWSQIRL